MKNLVKLVCTASLLVLAAPYAEADVVIQDKPEPQKPAPKKPEPKKEVPKKEKKSAKKTDGKKAADKKTDKKKAKKKKPKFKKYTDVITKKAITKKGVFTTHHIDAKVYFEIPKKQFGREFVWQVKIAGIQTKKGTISTDSSRQYIYFERIKDDLILRARDYSVISKDGAPETYVVNASDLDAILAKFKIVTFGENKTPVIDVTSIFMGGVKGLEGMRNGKMDRKSAVIKNVKAFERNIEARVLGKFSRRPARPIPGSRPTPASDVTAEVRHSIFALPDTLMKPRYYNHRVGYFDAQYSDFSGKKNKVETKRFIKRWRLVKKDPSAELSEPVKPIVWYIDPGTPKKYVEATKEGIEFWQVAFEQAGFKNAIVAKMAPTKAEDPDWDPEDARYAVVRWVPSDIPNAQGPHVADPRTGEIIEADVRMYHNVIKLIEEWYFAQAGATDPRAKKLPLPDDVMSDLVRFVVAHEVGHSIGLHHNMLGSNAYTIEQLRDPSFVAKNGVASSIMDYARFNYVMQPEDGTSPIDYVAGPYDKFAIEWGYTEFPGELSAEEEISHLNKIADRQLTNKALRWDAYSAGSRYDPRIQTEDISNDAIEATRLGQKNLRRIMDTLVSAASYEDGMTYDEVKVAYRALASQYNRELGHVAKLVGSAVYRNELAQGHSDADVYASYDVTRQKKALEFLADHAFKLPSFWQNKDVLKRVGYDTLMSTVSRFGTRPINSILSADRIDRLFSFNAAGLETYQPVEIFADMSDALFEELSDRKPDVSPYRRLIQAEMVNTLIKGMDVKRTRGGWRNPSRPVSEDYRSLCRATLVSLQKGLAKAAAKNKGSMTSIHFAGLASKIEDALDTD
ncbi:zinc-dependent metalloprotease [Temperatibacter marinus]|uniref:Zinc-dependent metalloprotease n=1 Tax=Temperatibacter marinus TaxID=1456591 RepID=A0AA52EEY2_9PROT|nr:zinc-dependent metalloprotease [Temperatibacter marinus]WND03556.1 zinc-dependent metalloprotease [Temperatibacter marinus]